MTKLLVLFSFLISTASIFAVDFEKDLMWTQTLKNLKLYSTQNDSQHAMCFEQNSKLIGVNQDKPLRIASISKLYTSFWALKTLGEDYRYKTTARYINKNLYIESNDVLFNREHIFRIIRELNAQNVFYINNVYVDKRVKWYHRNGSGSWLGRYDVDHKSYVMLSRMKLLFHINSDKRSGYYSSFLKWIETDDPEHNQPYPRMYASAVKYTDKQPTDEQSEVIITIESKTLKTYLKMMNAVSKNTLADDLFDTLGGAEKFHPFIFEELNTDKNSIAFYTGSGLNVDLPSIKRYDNLSTCALSIDLIKKVSEFLSEVEIEDILDYAPHDEGTLKSRFGNYSQLKGAIAAKTGTLNQKPAYALGGILSAKLEKMPFVILNQPLRAYKYNSRKFQEVMLDRLSKKTGLVRFDSIEKIAKSFVEHYASERLEADEQALTNAQAMLH